MIEPAFLKLGVWLHSVLVMRSTVKPCWLDWSYVTAAGSWSGVQSLPLNVTLRLQHRYQNGAAVI